MTQDQPTGHAGSPEPDDDAVPHPFGPGRPPEGPAEAEPAGEAAGAEPQADAEPETPDGPEAPAVAEGVSAINDLPAVPADIAPPQVVEVSMPDSEAGAVATSPRIER